MSQMLKPNAFLQGCQAALPIALGYIPVAIAFGMAAAAAGFPTWTILAMSLFIYAGASQFLLLASMMSGASIMAVVALCALLDSRHLLYAPLLKRHLKSSQGMIWIAPLITDEVFATAMAKLEEVDEQKPWLAGLAIVSWTAWWGGTLIGVFGGQKLANYPSMAAMMNFAFVALFACLSTHLCMSQPRFIPAFIVAAFSALLLSMLGYEEIVLLLSALSGVLFQLIFAKIIKALQPKDHQ